jgi:endonuclease/exonuclease/phosphatase family metal-dependent hydrolase
MSRTRPSGSDITYLISILTQENRVFSPNIIGLQTKLRTIHRHVNIVTWMTRALLSNSSVNKPQQQTVFYGVRAATVAMQWFGKHVSTREAVFSVGPV